jgi:hypothetical protein
VELGRRDYADAAAIAGAQAIGGSIWLADWTRRIRSRSGITARAARLARPRMFFEPSSNPYSTVVRLTDEPHLSGYISAPNLERLRGSPSLLVDQLGRGSVRNSW